MLAKVERAHTQKGTKCSFPLGPYPRYTWIHEDTPEDGLDKACYEIWKRVQQLSAQLDGNPKEARGCELNQAEAEVKAGEPGDTGRGRVNEKAAESCGKDDVSLLVQLEYLSIVGDHGSVDYHQYSSDGDGPAAEQGATITKEFQGHGSDALEKDNFLKYGQEAELGKSSLRKEVAQEESSSKLEPSTDVSVASNKEICLLLAQFPLKHINELEAPDNKVMMEEAQIIKDFLQNSMFSSAGDKKAEAPSPLPLSSQEWQDEESRRQLPVFAKLCEEDPAPAAKPLFTAAGSFEVPLSLSLASALDAKVQESVSDLVRMLCEGQKESYPSELEGQGSPKTFSPEMKEKSPGGVPGKSEHSYSTTRHSLKGSAPSVRRASQEAGKRDIPSGKVDPRHKEDSPAHSGKELAPHSAVFALGEEDAKVAPSKRECAPLDGESGAGHSIRVGPEPPVVEDGRVGVDKVSGGKEGKGRCRGNLFFSEAEPCGADKCAASTNPQPVGAGYDCCSKYSNGAYPARIAAGSMTLSGRPRLINYLPVPPGLPSASSNPGFAQQHPFYQTRTARLPHQQPTYPPAGCFVRSANPYNYNQMLQDYMPRQPYVRAAYAPMVGYWSFVPEYPYATRSTPKPLGTAGSSNNTPPMAGDGPQCLFQPAYGYLDSSVSATRFTSGRSGPLYNSSNFQMYFPADGSGYSYW